MNLPALALLASTLLTAENTDRTLHFQNAPSPAALQEAATVLRTVAGIDNLTLDPASAAISIRALPAQIATAEWLVSELDQPGNPTPDARRIRDAATHEYRLPGSKDDVIRIAFLTNTAGAREIQELVTTLRTVAGVKHIFQYTPAHAIAYRGATAEVNLAAWLITNLDQPHSPENPGTQQYGTGNDVTRVFYPPHSRGIQDLDRILAAVRINLRIEKAFVCTTPSAIVFRATAAQLDKAAQLVYTMDQRTTP